MLGTKSMMVCVFSKLHSATHNNEWKCQLLDFQRKKTEHFCQTHWGYYETFISVLFTADVIVL